MGMVLKGWRGGDGGGVRMFVVLVLNEGVRFGTGLEADGGGAGDGVEVGGGGADD